MSAPRLHLLVGILLLGTSGCHSAFIQTSITNQGPPLQNVEIDYPSQSFGVPVLQTGQVFHYRFKVQGSGPIKVQYQDKAGRLHSVTGPSLQEGTEGELSVIIAADGGVAWQPAFVAKP